ncbi:hypothetical protein RI129_010539 [Pyrocoelia pectoralis]|uniref:MADF domain-containing protein n=1 Tax=Pyrocoelia pectoralis TaxID=417401 RepID=A0AAN7ZI16_9COLE
MSFDTERFIIELQSRSSLWDTSSNDYSNRDLKKKCWEEVTNLFGGEEMIHGEKKVHIDKQIIEKRLDLHKLYSCTSFPTVHLQDLSKLNNKKPKKLENEEEGNKFFKRKLKMKMKQKVTPSQLLCSDPLDSSSAHEIEKEVLIEYEAEERERNEQEEITQDELDENPIREEESMDNGATAYDLRNGNVLNKP